MPVDQPRRTSQDSHSAVNENGWFEEYFLPTVGSYYGSSARGSEPRYRDDRHNGVDGTGDREMRVSDSEVEGGIGDLSKAMEKLVAGLLQENMRLGSVVDQLQVRATAAALSGRNERLVPADVDVLHAERFLAARARCHACCSHLLQYHLLSIMLLNALARR